MFADSQSHGAWGPRSRALYRFLYKWQHQGKAASPTSKSTEPPYKWSEGILVPLNNRLTEEFLRILQPHENTGLKKDKDQNEWLSSHVCSFPLNSDMGLSFPLNAELTSQPEFAHERNEHCLSF